MSESGREGEGVRRRKKGGREEGKREGKEKGREERADRGRVTEGMKYMYM